MGKLFFHKLWGKFLMRFYEEENSLVGLYIATFLGEKMRC